MKTAFGTILMLVGMFGSFIMCDRDFHPFKDNSDTIRIVDAVCIAVYGIGLHLLVTSA